MTLRPACQWYLVCDHYITAEVNQTSYDLFVLAEAHYNDVYVSQQRRTLAEQR